MMALFREHRIFSPRQDRLVLFVCLERLADRLFAVSHAEFLYEGDDLRKRMAEIAMTTVELLLDDEPEERLEFFPNIEDAVASHERAFANFEVGK